MNIVHVKFFFIYLFIYFFFIYMDNVTETWTAVINKVYTYYYLMREEENKDIFSRF